MKILRNTGLIAVALLAISACSGRLDGSETASTKSATAVNAISEMPKDGLPAQELLPGECGLFLWTRSEDLKFIFFSKGGSDEALFWLDGESQALTRTGLGGEIFGQQLTEQTFRLPDGRIMELDMTPGEKLVGGQRVPMAKIRIIDADGWATMIPAAGVTGCQPES